MMKDALMPIISNSISCKAKQSLSIHLKQADDKEAATKDTFIQVFIVIHYD